MDHTGNPTERSGRNSTINEFCHRNRLCRATAYKEINDGELPSIKVRGKRLITPEGEAVWLERKAEAAKLGGV